MAQVENTSLPNRHTLYLAATGHGKSQCFKRRAGIPGQGVRVVMWDTNRDHRASYHFTDRAQFARAMLEAYKSGKGFRIAWAGERGPEAFEWFCKCVWSILRGDRLTYVVVEEYGRASPGAGPILPTKYLYHSLLWGEGRKYGAIIHATSQRPQQVSKDALENAGEIWIGNCGRLARKLIQEETEVEATAIAALKPGDFIHWRRGKGSEFIHVFTPLEV